MRPLLLLSLLALGCPKTPAPTDAVSASAQAAAPIAYPEARRGDVVDDYHGTPVADPYRWLEDPDSPESRTWIEAENALTRSIVDGIPSRPAIATRLTGLWNYERFSTPSEHGGRYFWSRNDGLQDQAVLYTATALDAEPTVLIDPNTLSEDGTISLAGTAVSWDGRYIAYGLSDGGSDWRTWKVRDIETGEDLADTLDWIKFSGASWSKDNQGFYYSRFPEAENKLEALNENSKVYYHKLGTDQAADELVYEDPTHPRWGFYSDVSEDGRWLMLYVSEGTENKNRLYLQDLESKSGEWIKLHDAFDAYYNWLGSDGDRIWFTTDNNAPLGRVISLDVTKPAPADWTEVVPQTAETLDTASLVGGRVVVQYLKDARSLVRVHDRTSGEALREVNLPGIGSAGGFGGHFDSDETFFYFSGFSSPTRLYRYDIAKGEATLWKSPDVDFDPDAFETTQVFYESKDGTQVPMFLVHKKGLVLDGNNPTLLYGYGGFNIPLTPYFSVTRQVWMEMGGVYAVANLRGGGEYGVDWHKAGTLENKQNVFDDFIAAAEWLQANQYTRPEKLAIHGGSNGGLLVGATMAQRPDLFGAALPAVGVLDMLRYHLFTIGWAWASDYGRADDPEMFPHLYAYSPLHNLKSGTRYPSTMITTGDHDDRVVPAHSFKFAAELQRTHAGENPVLIRIETRAGHGAGKSTTMRIEEAADRWAFLAQELDFEPTLPAVGAVAAPAE